MQQATASSGKDIAMDSVSNLPSSDGMSSQPALDTRAIRLVQLATNAAVRRRMTEILESTDEQTRVPVAMFSSAI
jgi:hypothetical protein